MALAQDILVFAQTQDKRDILALQIGHPRIANELAIAHQCRNLHVRKCRTQAIQEIGALRGVRVCNMASIHSRPGEIEGRLVPGHWEGDLIKGAANRSSVGTLVARPRGTDSSKACCAS